MRNSMLDKALLESFQINKTFLYEIVILIFGVILFQIISKFIFCLADVLILLLFVFLHVKILLQLLEINTPIIGELIYQLFVLKLFFLGKNIPFLKKHRTDLFLCDENFLFLLLLWIKRYTMAPIFSDFYLKLLLDIRFLIYFALLIFTLSLVISLFNKQIDILNYKALILK